MRTICSYCRKTIRPGARGDSVLDVSHGMCPPCGEYFGRLWGGMQLSEYLELLPRPVLVVNAEGRVVAANRKAAETVGRPQRELEGLLGGEAMACAWSRLPEGCGKTVHCRECTIRRLVGEVAAERRPVARAPAWLETRGGRLALTLSARPVESCVEVTVLDAAPAAA